MSKHEWTERRIAAALAWSSCFSTSILVVPNCSWTSHEADLLIIERNLRIIDVEIKISRSDFKADAKKDKWWIGRPWSRTPGQNQRRIWPNKVWKHYYVLPEEIWDKELLDHLASPACGVITIGPQDLRFRGGAAVKVQKRAVPDRTAQPITPADAIDIARLANLRMWSAIRRDAV